MQVDQSERTCIDPTICMVCLLEQVEWFSCKSIAFDSNYIYIYIYIKLLKHTNITKLYTIQIHKF